jgi:HSP20 family protein
MEAWKSMDPVDAEDQGRRKRTTPDPFGDDVFDDLFNSEIFKRLLKDKKLQDDIREMWDEMLDLMNNGQPGKSVIHGFKVQFGPDGKPHIEDFGNKPKRSAKGEFAASDEMEPLTDIIEGDDSVSITVEIPGVERDDVDLTATDDTLEITVDTPTRKYHKVIDLPCCVKAKSTKATYKNGVLDIVLDKKEKKKDSGGYRVSIE